MHIDNNLILLYNFNDFILKNKNKIIYSNNGPIQFLGTHDSKKNIWQWSWALLGKSPSWYNHKQVYEKVYHYGRIKNISLLTEKKINNIDKKKLDLILAYSLYLLNFNYIYPHKNEDNYDYYIIKNIKTYNKKEYIYNKNKLKKLGYISTYYEKKEKEEKILSLAKDIIKVSKSLS